MAEAATDTISRHTRGLDRAFEILEFLRVRRQPMRPNEIASEIGTPRSSVYELVNLLLSLGMLDYQGGDGRVFLGRRLYFLGTAYAKQFDLMRECDRVLIRLAEETRETAQMCLIATLCLVAPREDGLRHRVTYLDSLLNAAREISEKLGFHSAESPVAQARA